MEILGDEKNPKKSAIFFCYKCNYNTSDKKDYMKHINTLKHRSVSVGDLGDVKNPEKSAKQLICKNCNKEYKSTNGLWKHKKQCIVKINKINNHDNLIIEKLTYLIMNVVKQNQEVIKQNNELTNKITDVCKYQTNNTTNNNINCNNKTFNLNVFLNETCKNAMNMSDFINSLQIEYDDFEKVGEIGFVNGISNIIIKSLKDLDITKRPLHCTDKKREVVYVKEDNKWEKEDDNYTKTRKLIKKTADKNMRMIPEFKKKYPDCGKSSSKYSDKYDLLIIETMGGSGDNDFEKETKILKNIVKEVFINKSI
jgi:hypothetical protein